jgi:hypothetical protein
MTIASFREGFLRRESLEEGFLTSVRLFSVLRIPGCAKKLRSDHMVEVFSTGIISCIAPQEIVDKFHNDLVESEQRLIKEYFDYHAHNPNIHPSGTNWEFVFAKKKTG